MNELLFFLSALLAYGTVALIAKFFGKPGLVAWVGISTILANIAVAKQINLFGLENALGNIMFSSVYLATDIMTEVYGEKAAKRSVYIGLVSAVTFVVFGVIVNAAIPNKNDFVSDSLANVLSFTARITGASILAFFVSNLADVWLFNKFREHSTKRLWLRNNVCTIFCNCAENFLFAIVGFLGVFDLVTCLKFACAGCLFEILAGLLDTPFVYLGRKWARSRKDADAITE